MTETLTGGTVTRPYKLGESCKQLASKLYESARKSPVRANASYIQPLLAGTTGKAARRKQKTIRRKVKRHIEKIATLPPNEFTLTIRYESIDGELSDGEPRGYLTPVMELLLHNKD